jgi:putative nucleotidyltransferase with HDIG domain
MVQTSASFQGNSSAANDLISLSEVISALSYALDLSDGAVPGHALRSCLLGMRIAEELKLDEQTQSSLYFALLLKDLGRRGHQRRGPESIVAKLGLGRIAAEAVRGVEERWDGSGYPDALRGEQIPLLSRICAVAQHLDAFSVERGIAGAIENLRERSGTYFDPELVRIAVSLHQRGDLWSHCQPSTHQEDSRRAVLDHDAGKRHSLQAGQIDLICEAFAEVVDAKSHFTFRHSVGVADTAYGVARRLGLTGERVQLVRRAALLHDVGKLSLSNEILDKTTRLNKAEWDAVYQHPKLTREILARVGAFQEMAIIAGEHHEKLDGTGYPNRLMAPDLSTESRIVAVADVYGALSEDRPYRRGLQSKKIVSILRNLTPEKLDKNCVDALVSMIEEDSMLVFPSVPTKSFAQFCA